MFAGLPNDHKTIIIAIERSSVSITKDFIIIKMLQDLKLPTESSPQKNVNNL